MAGLTTIALRKVICKFSVPGLLYTEMCLASVLPTENKKKNPMYFGGEKKKKIFL